MRQLTMLGIAMALCVLTACARENRDYRKPTPGNMPAGGYSMTGIYPGSTFPSGNTPRGRPLQMQNTEKGPYAVDAYDVSEGEKLYQAYNCVGCHAHGGGGMGPPLMDAKWIYGGEPQNIHDSIVEGRPGGMPSFRGKIPEFQVWQLVAYVRSMSGQLRKDVAPARDDHMNIKKSEQQTPRQGPVQQ